MTIKKKNSSLGNTVIARTKIDQLLYIIIYLSFNVKN